jgi:hypothetical protein
MSTISAPSSSPAFPVDLPIVEPPAAVQWMATVLEENEENIDEFIATIFEDLPPAEPKDYVEIDLADDAYEDCNCDECLGIYTEDDRYDDRYDDRDDGYGDWYWNDGGYCDW